MGYYSRGHAGLRASSIPVNFCFNCRQLALTYTLSIGSNIKTLNQHSGTVFQFLGSRMERIRHALRFRDQKSQSTGLFIPCCLKAMFGKAVEVKVLRWEMQI